MKVSVFLKLCCVCIALVVTTGTLRGSVGPGQGGHKKDTRVCLEHHECAHPNLLPSPKSIVKMMKRGMASKSKTSKKSKHRSMSPSLSSFAPSTNVSNTEPTLMPNVTPATTPLQHLGSSDFPSTGPTSPFNTVRPTHLSHTIPTTSKPFEVPPTVSSTQPSDLPSLISLTTFSRVPTLQPSTIPSQQLGYSDLPSTSPTISHTIPTTSKPSEVPQTVSSTQPSDLPSLIPLTSFSTLPTLQPSALPSQQLKSSDLPSTSPNTQWTTLPPSSSSTVTTTFSDTPSDVPSSMPSMNSPTKSALCEVHPACDKLDGDCCPTMDNVMMDCCTFDNVLSPSTNVAVVPIPPVSHTLLDTTAGTNLCSAYPACQELHGLCCPTLDNVMLDCCM